MRPTVLVVDDSSAQAQLTRLALADTPVSDRYTIEVAGGGRAGLKRIEDAIHQGESLFVICDQRMPDLTGLALLEAVHGRSDAPFRFVLYTIEAPQDVERQAFKLGADDVVTRMTDPSALIARLLPRIERWLVAAGNHVPGGVPSTGSAPKNRRGTARKA